MLYGDRVQETTLTQGTGTINLEGPTTGHRTFQAGIGFGNEFTYLILTPEGWEIGRGVVSAGTPHTMTRSVISSSNADALLNLVGGAAQFVMNVPIAGSFYNTHGFDLVATAVSLTAKPLQHVIVTAAAQTITLPASPEAGRTVRVTVGNFADTIVARNGSNIIGLAEDMTIDTVNTSVTFQFNSTLGWTIV